MSVVAIVPAFRSPDVAATVTALRSTGRIDRVIVVDDASADGTDQRALDAGATVVRFQTNRGKGAAVAAGFDAAPEAEIYLLVDADLGATAVHVAKLLDPVQDGTADLAIAGFPAAGRRGGFGVIKRGSARVIERLCGLRVEHPLSGQRAIRGTLARTLHLAPRYGLEVGMTVDAVRAGARCVEIPLPLDHDHKGRTLGGFRHRARQGLDIARAAVPRVGRPWMRQLAIVALVAAVLLGALAMHQSRRAGTVERADRVVVVTVSYGSLEDVTSGAMPNLRRILGQSGGLLAARTPSVPADQVSGYATLGAGAPVRLVEPDAGEPEIDETAGLDGEEDETIGQGPFVRIDPAGGALTVEVHRMPSDDTRSYGTAGLLGTALRHHGRSTAYVGARSGGSGLHTPAALAIADGHRRIDAAFLGSLPIEPTPALAGAVTDRVAATRQALTSSDVVLVDAGAAPVARIAGSPPLTDADREAREARRVGQLRVTDAFIGAIAQARLDATVMVVGMAPPNRWRLTPVALLGNRSGSLSSASTRQPDISTLTDVAPTVLSLLGEKRPKEMVGLPIGVDATPASVPRLEGLTQRAEIRERVYVPTIMTFVILQGVVYLVAVVALRRRRRLDAGWGTTLRVIERFAVLFASFPVSTFLWRLAPTRWQTPVVTVLGYVALSAGLAAVALRARRHPLSPLVVVAVVTTLVEIIDAATSGFLQNMSLLGYTPVTAARFYGMGNMGFAVLGASALIVAGAWVATLPNRRDGLVAAAALLALVTAADVLPSLGADFGGVLTFLPVFGATVLAWAGFRWSRTRVVALVVLCALAVVLIVVLEARSGGDGHLARFASGDLSAMWDVIVRKAATNLRVMRITFWTWMVPIIVLFIVGSLTAGDGWRRWFGGGREWRVTFSALLGFCVVGGLANDSGVVIPALALVYVGSFLLLVQTRQPFAPPEVLEP